MIVMIHILEHLCNFTKCPLQRSAYPELPWIQRLSHHTHTTQPFGAARCPTIRRGAPKDESSHLLYLLEVSKDIKWQYIISAKVLVVKLLKRLRTNVGVANSIICFYTFQLLSLILYLNSTFKSKNLSSNTSWGTILLIFALLY